MLYILQSVQKQIMIHNLGVIFMMMYMRKGKAKLSTCVVMASTMETRLIPSTKTKFNSMLSALTNKIWASIEAIMPSYDFWVCGMTIRPNLDPNMLAKESPIPIGQVKH